jgi:hypothetical protein
MDSFEDFLRKSKTFQEKTEKKKEFDRIEFYLEYYKNLSPSDFQIEIRNDKILITISN